MFDYHLKFIDENQAMSVLYRKEGVVEAYPENGIEANEGYAVPNFDCIDIIGAIYKPTGEVTTDEEGNEIPVMADVGGFHVNVRNYSATDALNDYVVTPKNPVRVWAGD